MDIYGADVHLAKGIEFLQGFSTSSSSMYSPTRARLKELGNKANQIMSLSLELLQEDVWSMDTEEFDTSKSPAELSRFIESVQAELNKLKQASATLGPQVSKVSVASDAEIPLVVRKRVVSEYGRALRAVAEISSQYTVVDDCCALLWRGFDTRFFVTPPAHPKFRYNIRRIPLWIQDIVILYGHALQHNYVDQFISGFNGWCDLLLTKDEVADKFAVPYDVYQFDKSNKSEYLTLTAVVLWDMLVDRGLGSVCTDADDLYLNRDRIYKMCGDVNPDELDAYTNYKQHPELLKRCNISRGGEQII